MRMLRDVPMELVSIPASASPATGSPKVHEQRVRAMMNHLFEHAGIKA
jgi:2-oxoglutarate dehydrogenase complex dehydrogenase (E1) component-like enzyme